MPKAILIKDNNLTIEDFNLDDTSSLKFLQKCVDGTICSAFRLESTPFRTIDAFCNDEGMINGMSPGVYVKYGRLEYVYFGPVVIVACDEKGETIGLEQNEMERFALTEPMIVQFEGHVFCVPQLIIRD